MNRTFETSKKSVLIVLFEILMLVGVSQVHTGVTDQGGLDTRERVDRSAEGGAEDYLRIVEERGHEMKCSVPEIGDLQEYDLIGMSTTGQAPDSFQEDARVLTLEVDEYRCLFGGPHPFDATGQLSNRDKSGSVHLRDKESGPGIQDTWGVAPVLDGIMEGASFR